MKLKKILTFSEALAELEKGKKLKRTDWTKKSCLGYLKIIRTKEKGCVNQDFIAVFYDNGGLMPHPYHIDMFDIRGSWKIVEK